MKAFKFLTILLCLGLFLIPKDMLYAQSSKEDCCKMSHTEKMDCCKNHKTSTQGHGDHDNKNSSCNDDCCSSCIICYTFIEIPSLNSTLSSLPPVYNLGKNPVFKYADPYISDSLEEIWQPPKIG
ncbi:hypothetical protein [Chryseobacterium sp. CT-SW4]|uniref:hypothetical protein n=1 Tax=Chryseobacterium sp. SW-1 TaxID=3157343 RepID=UPI003B0172BF